MRRRLLGTVPALLLTAALAGCGVADGAEPAAGGDSSAGTPAPAQSAEPTPSSPSATSPSTPDPTTSAAQPLPSSPEATMSAGQQPSGTPSAAPTSPGVDEAAADEPKRSYLSVPDLGLRDVPVVRYVGRPDDAPGTRIQNRGPAASPRGPRGGVGPGEVGNFIVTAHRTSHSAPFRDLPGLRDGARVLVRSGDRVFTYEVVDTRRVSFRSARSLAKQAAAVPGRPGATPVDPMITLSTCATPEDHAAGNYWSDRFGNPEHRIDKVGVLREVRPAG